MKKAISTVGLLAILFTGSYTSAAFADGTIVVGADAPPAVVITPSTNCSASSPCGNYAVVNSNGFSGTRISSTGACWSRMV